MWAVFAPVSGMLAAFLAMRGARLRGEERALLALGVSPLRVALFAVAAGALWGCAGAFVLLWEKADVALLFPRPALEAVWEVEGSDAVIERSLGLRLERSGELSFVEDEPRTMETGSRAGAPPPATLRLFAALSTLLTAVFGPLWAISPASGIRKISLGMLFALSLVLAFQAAASSPRYAWFVAAAPLLLVAEAFFLNYRARAPKIQIQKNKKYENER